MSAAGARSGLRAGTRTGVWYEVRRAIDELRPQLVLLENVRGLLSAGADSPVEPCSLCLGADSDHVLRALGAVVGDLADLGYVGCYRTVSASDAGAPHRRDRVFILAYPADSDVAAERASAVEAGSPVVAPVEGGQEPGRRGNREYAAIADARYDAPAQGDAHVGAAAGDSGTAGYPEGIRWRLGRGRERQGTPGQLGGIRAAQSEPRPQQAAADSGGEGLGQLPGGAPVQEAWPDAGHEPGDHHGERADRDGGAAADAVSRGWHGRSFITLRGSTLREAAWRLGARLAANAEIGGRDERLDGDGEEPPGSRGPAALDAGGSDGDDADAEFEGLEGLALESLVRSGELAEDDRPAQQWGQYESAIGRWEAILGRPAPRPAEPGPGGGMRLSPRFVEWMMGLPEGWVTGVPGLSRTDQLKCLGNGVVPQQLELALRQLLMIVTGNPVRGVPSGPRPITTLMPTPQVMDGKRGVRTPEQIAIARQGGGCANLRETAVLM